MPNRWLFKTEPTAYSFQDLTRDKRTVWDGVKNNLALKHLAGIKKGDEIFIYHTGDEKAVVGTARASSGAFPEAGKDPKLLVVAIEAGKPLARPVPLAEVKAQAHLKSFDLVRLPRLSIMPVNEEQWRAIEDLAEK
ncbi:MAG TPA: EVE domain-containing protein [Candidatus Binatia bacterium]